MTQKKRRDAGDSAPSAPDFDPVQLRYRRDGCTPDRQVAFIRALAECGCVAEACRRVGLSTEAVYALARRPDAQSFRLAWDIAMDNAVRRIGDNGFSRALHGVAIPHYYKGELVGEHRRWDERLTMFILRYRDPLSYGKHLDRADYRGHPESKAIALGNALDLVRKDAIREAHGLPRTFVRDISAAYDDDRDEYEEREPERTIDEEDDDFPDDDGPAGGGLPPDVASTSSTSGRPRNRRARRAAASRTRKR
jgi:hypothetical protein